MSKLKYKRRRVVLIILATITGNVIVTATPLPNNEYGKYLLSAFAIVMMFIIVWDTYFVEKLLAKSTKQILHDWINIALISSVTSLIIFKGITKNIDYLVTVFGLLGWSIAGAIAGLATAALGLTWSLYCEDSYRNSD